MITAKSIFKSDRRFPVYCKYAQQFYAQPAFITLNIENGEIDADYSSLTGGVPFDVFHGLVIRFPINPESTADQIGAIIEDNAALFQSILDKSSVEWKNGNKVGIVDYDLSELTDIGFQTYQEGGIIDMAQWIENDPFPAEGQSVTEFAQGILETDGQDGYFFQENMTADDILCELRTIWANHLYSGEELPKSVAQYLLDTGECDDSAWLDELRDFSK